MTKLRISPDLDLPEATVTSTILVLGGKGMGKTNLDAVIAEECSRCRLRFSWIDPIGIAWSLQHGATKTEPGVEVLALGGVHGDFPIEPTGGAVVADLVVDNDVSVVIDISRFKTGKMWSHGEQIRFVTEYFIRLYERQGEDRRPILQIFDEIGRFAPQKIAAGAIDIAKCLGAIEQVVELGRNVGIGMLMSTQRNARIAASIRELADAMFAFRTVGPLSLKAVVEWLGEHVEKKRIHDIVEQIRALPVGHAMLVSPGWLQIEKVVAVRKRTTFDASATPTGAGNRAPGEARKPDLDKYRALMAATIEKAKENDPAELRREVVQLRRDLELERKKKIAAPAPAKEKRVEIPVLKAAEIARLEQVVAHLERLAGEAHERLETQLSAVRQIAASVNDALRSARSGASSGSSGGGKHVASDGAPVRMGAPTSTGRQAEYGSGRTRVSGGAGSHGAGVSRPRPPASEREHENVSRPQQAMLDALAWLESVGIGGAKWSILGFLSNQSPKSSGFEKNVSTLRSGGLLEGNGKTQLFRLSDGGRAIANVPDVPASSEELQRAVYAKISTPQERMLRALVDVFPRNLTWDELAEKGEQSPTSSGFEKNVSTLKSFGLIDGGRATGFVAMPQLFIEEAMSA